MNLSLSSEQILNWKDLIPTLDLTDLTTQPVSFFDLQCRAKTAIQQFLQNSYRSLLVLKADDQSEYAPLLTQYIESILPAREQVIGANYIIEQADSFSFARISVEPAQSINDNFAATQTVASALYFDENKLFGSLQVHAISKDIQLNKGLIHQVNGGVLILSVAGLLAQFELWPRLKQILTSHRFDWYSTHPFKPLPCDIPSYPIDLKVILLGSRDELAAFSELDEELFALSDYSELESYFSVEEKSQQIQWAQYVNSMAKQAGFPSLSEQGLNRLYQLLVRDSEDRTLINISPLKLKTLLAQATLFRQSETLSAVEFEEIFQQKQMQQSFLRERTYDDIWHEQVYIPTDGEAVGQINGLSVIEYQGTPTSFGEPSRISCIVQYGDGEIIDVDRKSELAGNIHGKGMMIVESCLANILELPSQLPFSASLVFEQSYSEIDGDSASLAAFCALTSALSDLPLPQSIAVTGTIDQLGLVHAVGGVNDKIEGFFAICEKRGLTGEQGVIIPTAVIHQLSLSQEVVTAVKNKQFFIWVVEDVYQACEILFNRDLIEEDKNYTQQNLPISRLIAQRIEQRAEHHSRGLLSFLLGRK
ncbi:AAA family ATPase [Pasteurella bettyae]|uniref:endopeptidase La n=1 Tax=Pasteurella bettyae CCUG 2042 TaxID=1095749 RepID=I3D6V4_9PAST|nr:Lon protease family protein [Pasteurella bettyae]EIJ67447.1 lon protease S16 C-terminal proteolytic domain protein [Pasteurella bettyae CCUG 2042]SUB21827.1 putative Lon protease [Pasteurella bettyae]